MIILKHSRRTTSGADEKNQQPSSRYPPNEYLLLAMVQQCWFSCSLILTSLQEMLMLGKNSIRAIFLADRPITWQYMKHIVVARSLHLRLRGMHKCCMSSNVAWSCVV
jgi:hypothetical protein